MHARRAQRFSQHLESVCWVVGTTLLVTYGIARADALWGARHDIGRLELTRAPDLSTWSRSRIEAYRASALVLSDPLVGIVAIPTVDLEVPLYADTSELHLNRGAGLIPGMARPGGAGNLGIAGHRDGYFRALRNVKVGEPIEVRTRTADYHYRIAGLSVVSATDARLLAPTRDDAITLVTCYPFYFVGSAPQRFVVRGVRVQPEETFR